MPRRPGETSGDDETNQAAHGAAIPAPPELLGLHYHTGPLNRAPLHPHLKTLLGLWNERRGKRAMPERADLPLSDLKFWQPNLALLEPVPGTFRFRLGGDALAPRLGQAMAGHMLAEIAPPLRRGIYGLLDLTTAKQAPIAAACSLRFRGERTLWSDLMLPLSGGRAGPPLKLFASYPVS